MIKIANAPCSWGVLEFDLEGEALTYPDVLDEMSETGYIGTELGDWGFMPTDPDALSAELANRRLELLGAFVPVALCQTSHHKGGVEEALKIAKLMYNAGFSNSKIVLADENGTVQNRVKNAGRIQPSMQLTPDEWKVFGKGANEVAKAVKDAYGLQTVFHHHGAGYVETTNEVERLLENTDPDLVGLCLDTGHCMLGGGNPVKWLKSFSERIWHIHFKDFDPVVLAKAHINSWDYFECVKNGIFCELGKGDVDFKAVLAELKKQQYDDWIVVEQDVLPGMGEPKKCAEANRTYLKTIGL